MVEMIRRMEMAEWVEPVPGLAASMLMPTERAGPAIRANRPRLKNLVDDAERQFAEAGLSTGDARERLARVRDALDDPAFWRRQGEGLAVFATECGPRWVHTPFPLPELAVVADRMHVKPLMRLADGEGRAFILALSGRRARLFEATPGSCREVDLPDMPASYEEAMRHDEPEKQVQFHTGAPSGGAAVRRPAIHHGQGATHDEDVENRRWRQYCQAVENAVTDALEATDAPLLLAAAEPTLSIYREVNRHAGLMDQALEGNHDRFDAGEIHREAMDKALNDRLDRRRSKVLEVFAEAAGTEPATSDLLEGVVAADDGRVETLLVASDVRRWGEYKPEKRVIAASDKPTPGRDDLLNFAACRAFETGAEVFCPPMAEMPVDSPIAAVLRVAQP